MHVAIFPTWDCQLSCSYCSIRNSKIDRSVRGVAWGQWALGLATHLTPNSVVDIAGGEPLLYPGIVELLHALGSHRIAWAITTNGKATEVVEKICREKPNGGVCFNISDHPGNPEVGENKRKLRDAGYNVNVHRVDHPDAGHHEDDAQLIGYQDWKGGKAVDGAIRSCTAGIDHWVAGPNGDMWRCIVAARTAQPPTGNLFSGQVRPTSTRCEFGCSNCYTERPSDWCVEMREIEAGSG